MRGLHRNNHDIARLSGPHRKGLLGVMAVGLIARIAAALLVEGHPIDVFDFRFWSNYAKEQGLHGFYDGDVFADYPPGYIYVLYALGWLRSMLGVGDGTVAHVLLLKLPAMAADLAAVYALYRLALRKWNATAAVWMSAIYALNPVIWLNSAAWGQVDGWFAAFMVSAIWKLDEGRYRSAAVYYAIATLTKPQALLFAPLFLLKLVSERRLRPWLDVLAYAIGTFVLLLLPFAYGRPAGWIFELYLGTLRSYPYASVNAFNLHALAGGNWVDVKERFLFLSFETWGFLGIAFAVASTGYWYLRGRDRSGLLPFGAAWLMLTVFLFAAKMHERYVFPAFLLMVIVWILTKDKRWGYGYGLLTAGQLINVGYVLSESLNERYHIPTHHPLVVLSALLHLAAWAAMAWVGWHWFMKGSIRGNKGEKATVKEKGHNSKEKADKIAGTKPSLFGDRLNDARMTRLDRRFMLGILIVYLAVALVRLGNTDAPQTYWKPSATGEGFYADLGEAKTIARITTYGGAGMGDFRVSVSEDAKEWSTYGNVEQGHADVFIWRPVESAKPTVEARYVKIETTDVGYILNEAAIFGPDRELLPVFDVVEEERGDRTLGRSRHVFDEPQWAAWKADALNSTYFDEIYHARTAYEFLKKLEPYETTHPPLGKVIQSLGIWLFGMTPFGWRIVGTIGGALLLPLMYVLAKALFRSTRLAALATFFMAVDFMHFAQTRMGTVDTYIVMFTMLMFYWMHRYMQTNFHRQPLVHTLTPLALSGLFFGLAIAVKWNAMYGGAGLAVLFFWSLGRRYAEYRAAKKELRGSAGGEHAQRLTETKRRFPRYAMFTLASCLVFFIVVPIGVYAASYIPYLNATERDDGWRDLWDYQTHMYDYHSELEATHPFQSPWLEWPVIGRPLWLFGGDEMPEGRVATIVDMGNPAVWWSGLAALLAVAAYGLRKRDGTAMFLLVAFGSLYVPWVVSPRTLTFIYHYFPMTPFLILFLVYGLRLLEARYRWGRKVTYALAGASLLLFVLYYPALTGLEMSRDYAQYVLKWFDSWDFF